MEGNHKNKSRHKWNWKQENRGGKSMKRKTGSLEKKKSIKPQQSWLIKWEETQITNIGNEIRDIAIDPVAIKR